MAPHTPRTRDRSGKGAARKLRSAGQVPAVIYGHAREPQSLAARHARAREAARAHLGREHRHRARRRRHDVARTLIREIQRHPFKRRSSTSISRSWSPARRSPSACRSCSSAFRTAFAIGGGILDQMMRELDDRVDPANIPNHIEVDVTHAASSDTRMHVSDITLPEGVRCSTTPDATVCVVSRAARRGRGRRRPRRGRRRPSPELIRKTKEDEEESRDEVARSNVGRPLAPDALEPVKVIVGLGNPGREYERRVTTSAGGSSTTWPTFGISTAGARTAKRCVATGRVGGRAGATASSRRRT